MIYRWRLTAMAKGIRLEEIAHRVGKDIPFISRASRGLANPSNELKVAIAEIVNMPVEKAWRRING